MSLSARNSLIYFIIIILALFLVSRLVTVALLLIHAPEDAVPYFYLKQLVFAIIGIGLIGWFWNKRARQSDGEVRNS